MNWHIIPNNDIKKHLETTTCECGLEHRVDFRIKNRHIEFRAFRINKRKRN